MLWAPRFSVTQLTKSREKSPQCVKMLRLMVTWRACATKIDPRIAADRPDRHVAERHALRPPEENPLDARATRADDPQLLPRAGPDDELSVEAGTEHDLPARAAQLLGGAREAGLTADEDRQPLVGRGRRRATLHSQRSG